MIFSNFKNKDLAKAERLCKYLNKSIKRETRIETDFVCLGENGDDFIVVYNKKARTEGDSSVDLQFRLYYPTKNDIGYSKEASALFHEGKHVEYEAYIEKEYKKRKLYCAEIGWLAVEEKNKGIGTKIVKELINGLKDIDSLEMVLLTPKGPEAKRFWARNNFDEENCSYVKDRRERVSDNEMAYMLK